MIQLEKLPEQLEQNLPEEVRIIRRFYFEKIKEKENAKKNTFEIQG